MSEVLPQIIIPATVTRTKLLNIAWDLEPNETYETKALKLATILDFPAYPLSIDTERQTLTSCEKTEGITDRETRIIALLASNPDSLFHKGTIYEHVWGPYVAGDKHVVEVHITNMKRKMGKLAIPNPFVNVRGRGIIFASEPPSRR